MLVLVLQALLQGLQRQPREKMMEFKGRVADYTRSSFQGITLDEVVLFIVNLQKMVPNEFHQYIDWNQTRTEQGNWPTKTIVNMCFKNETHLATMMGLLKVDQDELKKRYPSKIMFGRSPQDQTWTLKSNLWRRHMLCFTKASKQWVEINS